MTRRFDMDSTAEEVARDIDLSGKTAVVTGVSAGLGIETARVLASRGAKVMYRPNFPTETPSSDRKSVV